MDFLTIDRQIKDLSKQFLNEDLEHASSILEKLESLIESYLAHHPNDLNMWMRLAIAVYTRPLADDLKAVACLEKVLKQDTGNNEALLILSYIQDGFAIIDDALLKRIERAIQEEQDSIIKGMLYKMAASGAMSDKNKYQFFLEASAFFAPYHVKNHMLLGFLYIEQHDFERAERVLKTALNNIQSVDVESISGDITSVDDFLESYIQGIHTTSVIRSWILNSLV